MSETFDRGDALLEQQKELEYLYPRTRQSVVCVKSFVLQFGVSQFFMQHGINVRFGIDALLTWLS